MNYAITILGVVLGGIATLVTIVFTIISLSTGKTRNAGFWGIGFVGAITVLIFSIVSMVQTITSKVKTGIEWLEAHDKNLEDVSDIDYQQIARNNWIDTLREYTNGTYEGKVPADFYSSQPVDMDSTGVMVVPFLYPYSLKINSYSNVANIINDVKDSVYVENIAQLAFDQNFVIAKIDNSADKELLKKGHAEIEYLLFDMRTGNYESAANIEKLYDFADRIGYTGSKELKLIAEDYAGWFDYVEYD